MRLGSSIIGGKPMRIPGIVDVYQIGDQWVARSWPKVANQPNSAAQLLWRKKFKDAHNLLHTWTGEYLDCWRAVSAPSGKMWIDIAVHSLLVGTPNYTPTHTIPEMSMHLYYEPDLSLVSPDPYGVTWRENYCLVMNFAAATLFTSREWNQGRYGSSFDEVLKWNDLGYICPKGKRPRKHWGLSFSSPPIVWVFGQYVWIGGELWLFYFNNYDARGMALLRLDQIIDPITNYHDYALLTSPLYRKPEPWPGHVEP